MLLILQFKSFFPKLSSTLYIGRCQLSYKTLGNIFVNVVNIFVNVVKLNDLFINYFYMIICFKIKHFLLPLIQQMIRKIMRYWMKDNEILEYTKIKNFTIDSLTNPSIITNPAYGAQNSSIYSAQKLYPKVHYLHSPQQN